MSVAAIVLVHANVNSISVCFSLVEIEYDGYFG